MKSTIFKGALAFVIVIGTSTAVNAQLNETVSKEYGFLPEVYLPEQNFFGTKIVHEESGEQIIVHCTKNISVDVCVEFQFFLIPSVNRPYGHPLTSESYQFGQLVPIYQDAEKVFPNTLHLTILPVSKKIYRNRFYGKDDGYLSDAAINRKYRLNGTILASVVDWVGVAGGVTGAFMIGSTVAASAAAGPFVLGGAITLWMSPFLVDVGTLPIRAVTKGSAVLLREMSLERRENWFEEDLRELLVKSNPKPVEVSDRRFKSLIFGLQTMGKYMAKVNPVVQPKR
jgi:hypothetical protein